MSNFKNKVLTQLTLGERLTQARLGQNLDLEDISQEISIKAEYLSYLEQGNYKQLPSLVFVENYLKIYSQYLGLSWPQLKKIYDQEIAVLKTPPPKSKITTHFNKPALLLPRFLYLALTVLILSLLFTYLGLQITNFLQPPNLEIFYPTENLTISEKFINLEGQTAPEAQVTINGQEIAVDGQGHFKELVSLQSGFNNLRISAKTKHSREQVIYRQIVVDN